MIYPERYECWQHREKEYRRMCRLLDRVAAAYVDAERRDDVDRCHDLVARYARIESRNRTDLVTFDEAMRHLEAHVTEQKIDQAASGWFESASY